MARIPEETVELILHQTDIVDLISSYIPLKRAGSSFKANCPFHNENTPSFHVTPSRQSFHCFGCGESGSAIGFVMKYENLPFTDACKKLASRAGVQIIEDVYDPEADKRRRSKSRLVELHNSAANFFHQLVRKSPDAQLARDYLQKRGFSSESAERWLIGWMPEKPQVFTQWAKDNQFTARELVASGLASFKDESNPRSGIFIRFRNRLMFPIFNDYGDIIAFSGRQLITDPNSGKYINSPQTQLFDKSKVFFGLDKARRHIAKDKFALICEGQIDAIVCHENGIQNAVAPLGTAFTEHHARLLKRYTDNVILCFDADSAGHKAAQRAFAILVPAGLHVRCASIPQGEDPDSYIQKFGADAFKSLLAESREFFDFKLSYAAANTDLSQIQNKSALANELADLARLVTDKVAQDSIISQVAARLSIGDNDFRDLILKAHKNKRFERKYDENQQPKDSVEPTTMDNSVSYLCFLALNFNDIQEWICEQLESIAEPLASTTGGHLLNKILAKKPDVNSPAAVQSFLMTLDTADQLAIQRLLHQERPDTPLRAAEETTAMLINKHLQKREAAIRAALKQPHLTSDELTRLLSETKQIQSLLKNLSQRFIR